jgi:hypothetical protein
MKKRFKLRKKKSRKMFTRNAKRVSKVNSWNPLRGGIRL